MLSLFKVSLVEAGPPRSRDLLPDINLARHRGGDERGAQLLKALDGLADLGDEGVDPRCLPVEEGGDGALFGHRWARNVEAFDLGDVDSLECRPDRNRLNLTHYDRRIELVREIELIPFRSDEAHILSHAKRLVSLYVCGGTDRRIPTVDDVSSPRPAASSGQIRKVIQGDLSRSAEDKPAWLNLGCADYRQT